MHVYDGDVGTVPFGIQSRFSHLLRNMNSELVLPRVKLSNSLNVSVVDIEDDALPKKTVDVVSEVRRVFNSHRTRPYSFRLNQLKGLVKFLQVEEEALCDALYEDLKKSKFEAVSHEIEFALKDAKEAVTNLQSWMKPERPRKTAANFFDDLYIYNDPYGVVLLIAPWNFPVQLLIIPLIGAIAAGNCVVIKPSEIASATAQVFATLLPKYIDSQCYPVVLGGPEDTTELLQQRFDYIFFTGSPKVGKTVYQAASKYLTPTTLEMGGKSPVYIDSTADMELTAKRIMWGKTQNAGQICIAPDYILCTKKVQEKFVLHAAKALQAFYDDKVKSSTDYGRIASLKHFNRLVDLLRNQKPAIGGQSDPHNLFIEPTVLVEVSPMDPVMQEEIFGPILPIVNIRNMDEAIDFINDREKPLALYVFTNDQSVKDAFLERTSSGSVAINDTVLQVVADGLPFGGVGNSGIGAYHGKKTFDTFVHKKSVLSKGFFFLPEKIESVRYPPYTNMKLNVLKARFRYNHSLPTKYVSHVVMFMLGVLVTIAVYYIILLFNEN
ncbi:aldehyde dehydrogenase, dimeric NADP-preferring-like [Anoplophora glabripennis]|uniref:aldehyde dehydrogenase, dimeric NADP-preferring-like n=1 Tax=Anoplophora glabripennis TaxID=217634 RepID=UPI0008754F69|nr:aldehyde dehydrogenase, dimeric NADP-preferring-like [Anoplophora glabripennis]